MVAARKVTWLAAVVFCGACRGAGALPAEEVGRETVLVLFHGCHDGASSRDWKPLRDALPREVAVIAPELPRIEADGDNAAWMAAWRKGGAATVDRAFTAARRQHPNAFLVSGGAGCGGFFALVGAEKYDVSAVITLSGLSDEAQRKRLATGRIPVLGMASKDDGQVPARVEAIVRSGGPGSLFRTYPGRAHGTAILQSDSAPAKSIVQWLRERTAAPRRAAGTDVAPSSP